MKKYLVLLLIAFVCFTSCEEDLIVYDTPNGFLQVAAETASVTENDPSDVVTTFLYGGSSNVSGITVNYTVTGDTSRFNLTPSTGSVEIPAGEFSASIVLTAIDNFASDGNEDVVITISDGSLPVGIGGEGNFSVSKTITIIDDDCPITINDWVGTYSVAEQFTAGVNSPLGLADFFGESYQLDAILAPGDTTGIKIAFSNSLGFNTYIADGTVMTFFTCSSTVGFDAGFPEVALFRVFEFETATYDEAGLSISAEGPLATFGPYIFTFTRM